LFAQHLTLDKVGEWYDFIPAKARKRCFAGYCSYDRNKIGVRCAEPFSTVNCHHLDFGPRLKVKTFRENNVACV
jgi:hypothetical protein